MLKITDDPDHNCLRVVPEGRLTESDFDHLTGFFNDRVTRTGKVPNLVIHAESFPGWADFGGLVGHLGFVREHHRLIRKIALVSDARVLDVAPQVARHFLHADLRHFPANALSEALDWVAAPDSDGAALSLIEGLGDDVLGIEVRGAVTARDYAEVVEPAMRDKLAAHPKLKLLYRVTPDFHSVTAGALWSDARLGLMNLTRFSRIALVADQDWMRNAVRLLAPLVPGEVRVFLGEEYGTAVAWVRRADPPDEPSEIDRSWDA